jgi:integrase
MIGTITKRARQDGTPAWGYSFFAGRTAVGKRIQITKNGFDTRKEAAEQRYVTLCRHAKSVSVKAELQGLAPLAIGSMLNSLLDSGGRKDEIHPNGRPLSARTVRHVAFLIHDSLETAVRWGLLPANRMDRVVLPKAEKKEIQAMDKQGLSQLLGALRRTSLFPLFVMAASTGCRHGELLAPEWRDIVFGTRMPVSCSVRACRFQLFRSGSITLIQQLR